MDLKTETNEVKTEAASEPTNLINARYYCPLGLTLFERNEYGDLEEYGADYDGRACAPYEEEVKRLCAHEHSYNGCDPKSLATYQENPKVRSVEFDVDEIGGTLYGCIRCGLTAPLTAAEENIFKDWLTGECSDGFGEGLEQRDFETDERIVNFHFWSSGNGYFMKNENEFRDYLRNINSQKMGGM